MFARPRVQLRRQSVYSRSANLAARQPVREHPPQRVTARAYSTPARMTHSDNVLPFVRLLDKNIDYSQDNILNKMVKYLSLQGRDPDFVKKIETSSGYCNGFAVKAGYALWLESQKKEADGRQNNQPRDDASQHWQTLTRMAAWDGKSLPGKSDQEEFDRLIAHVEYFQEAYQLNNTPDHAEERLRDLQQSDLDCFLFDTLNRSIRRDYVFKSFFHQNDLLNVIRLPGENRTTTLFQELIQRNRIIRICSGTHATSLFYHGNYHYFYDSNDDNGIAIYPENQPALVIDHMMRSFGYHPRRRSRIELISYGFEDTALHVPNQADLVAAVTDLNPFLRASRTGSVKSVRSQLLHGQRVNKPGFNLMTALSVAAWYGQTDVVRLLLSQDGIDVNHADVRFNTPLHLACATGHADIVQILLGRKDINVNSTNYDDLTPFHLASQNKHADIAQLLHYEPRNNMRKAREESESHSFGRSPISFWSQAKRTSVLKQAVSLPVSHSLRPI